MDTCDVNLVASHALRRSRTPECQISNKCPDSDGQHDPAVICHKEEPVFIRFCVSVGGKEFLT